MDTIFKIPSLFPSFFNLFKTERIEDNVISVVYKTVKISKVKVTYTSIVEFFKTHPNYPSLKSICDFFNEMNIRNFPIRLSESELFDLNKPFIAHTKNSGGKVLLIYSIDKKSVIYVDSLNGKKLISTSQFLEEWDEVIILVDPSELSGENDYNYKRKYEIVKKALLPCSICLFGLIIVYGSFTNKYSLETAESIQIFLIFTHLLGLAFSLLLFMNELNLKTKFINKLCHISANSDCDAVSKSKASKIFGIISWSEIGVSYFLGGLLIFFLIPDANTLNLLALLSLVSLPYPVFSILYQWLTLKKWCPLCILVQIVLIMEFLIFLKITNINGLTSIPIIAGLLILLIVFFLILLQKLFIISDKEKESIKIEALKIKRDPIIFNSKLKERERIEFPTDKHALIFGDISSEIMISVFLSFDCSFCAKKFDSIIKLITDNCKLKVQLILSPTKDESSMILLKIIFGFMKAGQYNKVLEELKTCYNLNSKSGFKNHYIKNILAVPEGFEDMVSYNSLLFKKGKVIGVPSIYVNGYPLPEMYSLEDIKYHITELEKM